MEDVLNFGLRKIGYQDFREGQREVVKAYLAGKDVLFCTPTGSGKSLYFEIAPYVFEATCIGVHEAERNGAEMSSVCLIVAPLVSLMKDQVKSLRRRGIRA